MDTLRISMYLLSNTKDSLRFFNTFPKKTNDSLEDFNVIPNVALFSQKSVRVQRLDRSEIKPD